MAFYRGYHALAALADRFGEVIHFDNLARNISDCQFHNLHFSGIYYRHISLQPLTHELHVVFGGNDRRSLVRRREACTLIAVDPLFECGDAPCFGGIEKAVQRADRLRERNNKGFVVHKSVIYRFSF